MSTTVGDDKQQERLTNEGSKDEGKDGKGNRNGDEGGG
jgi:hypothetical protein